jgi:PhnB protein
MRLHAYLNFNGNCREAFDYYAMHLGGRVEMVMTHAEVPGGSPLGPEWGSKIVHARLRIAGTEILGSDVPPERQKPMRSVYLSLTVDGVAEAERVHTALADGGEVIQALSETFWAERFGVVRDRFGTLWMVNAD